MINYHISVMPDEVIEYLDVQPGEWYLDATLGDGGHSLLLAKAGAKVWGMDQDPEAIERASHRLETELEFPIQNQGKEIKPVDKETKVVLTRGNFEDLEAQAEGLRLPLLAGILFDFGASTLQLTSPTRGFSLLSDAPLDMRMDPETNAVTAADLVNALSERELTSIFGELGGEHAAKRIAQAIVTKRKDGRITSTQQLADLVERVVPRRGKLHPATKVFQALRMVVNRERPVIAQGLEAALKQLKPGGRLVTIAFHEGEDAIVKRFFKQAQESEIINILTPKPVPPTDLEVEANPRARSAKLRAATRN
jgi:16S rRNA (cytosine1402-N4)-methyltransferase